MNSMILSFFVAIVAVFHLAVRTTIKKGKVQEAFCAHWCIDAVFAVSGTVISFAIYQYDIFTFLTLRNIILGLVYLLATLLLVLLAPSGHRLLTHKPSAPPEEILLAEYRFNDTLCLIRNFFLALLFGIPVILSILTQTEIPLPILPIWSNIEISGGFCFTAFLILLPISLRQAFFWLKHLTGTPDEQEAHALKQYRMQLHYKHRNLRL